MSCGYLRKGNNQLVGMTKQINDMMRERVDNEILFFKVVKAGKRIYYIDVKRDRRDELYISLTESKRLKDTGVGEDARPVFEKHKIFLYREDLEKFKTAFLEAADFASTGELPESEPEAEPEEEPAGTEEKDFKLDIDF